MITKESMVWSFNEFSQTIFQEMYGGQSEEFILWSLGLKG